MNNLIAQVKKMQKDIQNKQEEIYNMVFLGTSEWVNVEVFGNKKIKKISIINKNIKDDEDYECLEDMIKLALDDAYNKVEKEIEKKLGAYSNSLGGLF